MTRSASLRLRAYAGLAGLGLVAGLASGRIELVVLATPFALAAAAVLALAVEPQLVARISLSRERALEGDDVTVHVELVSATGATQLDVFVPLPRELTLREGARNPRAVRRMRAIVAEMQPWLPYCNRQRTALMLWFAVSQVLPKEGLHESPRHAPAQLSVAS